LKNPKRILRSKRLEGDEENIKILIMRYENFYQNPIDGKDEDERIG
jgi:hypothetical protein